MMELPITFYYTVTITVDEGAIDDLITVYDAPEEITHDEVALRNYIEEFIDDAVFTDLTVKVTPAKEGTSGS